MWMIIHTYKVPVQNYEEVDPLPVNNGDIIRLMHNATGHFLHSHQVKAHVNTNDFEVSGYGEINLEDPNDLWQVEIVKDTRSGESILRALTTKFRLKHVQTGCYLKSRNNKLPDWGFNQGEVSCDYTPELNAKYLLWNVETHVNDKCTFYHRMTNH
jgi:dolichyl-phosphate-mannose-protein mannosyltransferase